MALATGHVTWTATKLLPDGIDVGTAPDYAAVVAYVTFHRPQGFIVDPSVPQTVFVKPQTYSVDVNGVLRDGQGATGVDLPIGPWQTIFDVPGYVQPKPFTFNVPLGETVDLADVMPLADDGVSLITKGDPGPAGPSGLSAYQVAVANGFVGTEAAWLLSLKGATGSTTATTSASDLTSGTLAAARIADASLPASKLTGLATVATTGSYTDLSNRPASDPVAITAGLRSLGTGAQQAASGVHTHLATDLSDSTTLGRSLTRVVNAADARGAIGAGTSSLAIGTTSTTAAAGDHLHDSRYVRTVNSVGPDGTGNVVVSGGSTVDYARMVRDAYELKAYPYDPLLATASQIMTSGTMYVSRVYVIPGEVLTTFQTQVTSVGSAVTLFRAGLYLLDGTLVRSTVSMTPANGMNSSAWQTGGTNTTYTVPVGVTSMYIGLIAVGTTGPTINRAPSPTAANTLTYTMTSGHRAATRSGQTDIPSPAGTLVAANVMTYLSST